jgi:hypothetical protein
MQHHALQQFVVAAMLQVVARDRRILRLGIDIHWRHPDDLTRLHACIGLDATAIDTHLAGAQKLLQRTEAEAGKMDLEPAIEAHTRLIRFNRNMFNASHESSFGKSCQRRARPLPVALEHF